MAAPAFSATHALWAGRLRTGEMFQLRRRDVVLPQHSGQSAMVFLHDTKTAQRNFQPSEKVLISEQAGISCLRLLCNDVGLMIIW